MTSNVMKYVDYVSGGEADELSIKQREIPQINNNEILVKVNAFGINRADTLQRRGKYPPPSGESDILGLEVAGEVVDIGVDVTSHSVGDRVFGLVAGGGYAQYVKLLASHGIKTPRSLTDCQAAGIAEVFLTAFQSLFEIGNIQANDSILIHAGASGVGLAATQLARLSGCHTAVTSSSDEKLAICAEYGARTLINYQQTCFADALRQQHISPDLIIDFVGGDYLNRNLKVLKQDGVIVQLALLAGRYSDPMDLGLLLAKRAKIIGSTLRNRHDSYKTMLIQHFSNRFLASFEQGELKANIDTIYPISKVSEAHRRIENNDTIGKLIISWDSSKASD